MKTILLGMLLVSQTVFVQSKQDSSGLEQSELSLNGIVPQKPAAVSPAPVRRQAQNNVFEMPATNNDADGYCGYRDWLDNISDKGSPSGEVTGVDRVVVRKDKKEMYLFHFDDGKPELLKTYKVALGFRPYGHKEKVKDGRTPEGIYSISLKQPYSKYHLSLKISYPSKADIADAKRRRVSTGGDIMIHGLPNDEEHKKMVLFGDLSGLSAAERKLYYDDDVNPNGLVHPEFNWTYGCIAVTDEEIEEIYQAVHTGTIVEICANPY